VFIRLQPIPDRERDWLGLRGLQWFLDRRSPQDGAEWGSKQPGGVRNTMSSPIDTVKAFLGAWEPAHGWKKAFETYMTPDCVYENIGMSKTTGPAESIAFIQILADSMSFASLVVDYGAVLAQGNTVVTERVDHLNDAGGKRLMSLRVLGIFEVRDGKIAGWRDYFDTVPFAPK
jgi:limonene-1,2-epoxide hydrolase